MTRFKNTTAIGTPSHYCIRGGYLELWKKPDHSLNADEAWEINLEFYGYLTDLSSSNTTNEIETNYPLALEYHATAQGFRYGMDMETAEYYEAKYEEIFKQIVNEDETRKAAAVHDHIRPGVGQSLSGSDDIFGETLRAFYE